MSKFKITFFIPCVLFTVVLAAFVVTGCNGTTTIEDYVETGGAAAYDPAQPVKISNFTPTQGGVGQQLVINGSNFGNDTAKVNVTIGGQKAVLVNVKGNSLYCFVPAGAFTGEVTVTVGDDAVGKQTAEAADKFNYQRKMVAGTLCGYKNARDDQGWVDGPFATCCGFRNYGFMHFSPYDPNQLFVVYDQEPYWGVVAHGIQLIDLKKEEVQTILPLSMFNNERLRSIDFAIDPFKYDADGKIVGRSDATWHSTAPLNERQWCDHLIIAADNYDSHNRAHSVYIVDRDVQGKFSSSSPHRLLACYQQCNGAVLHPVNGELYFNSYADGSVLKMDMDLYWETVEAEGTWDPYVEDNLYNSATGSASGTGAFEKLFKVQDNRWNFQIYIHPSGKYAYIVVINRNYILRTDYDEVNKRFSSPYLVAGKIDSGDFIDGVGKSARMNFPCQGTFVQNDEYVKEGREDVYDFYFCDCYNHSIRSLSPFGIVSTYAGGSKETHSDNKREGAEDGELRRVARFYEPTGLASNFRTDPSTGEKTPAFYILDSRNCKIRTIAMEKKNP